MHRLRRATGNDAGKHEEKKMGAAGAKSTEEKMTMQERVKRGRLPVAELVGFRITEAAGGRAVADFEAGPQHANLNGTLHGGILCDVSDAAMGLAFATTIEGEQSFTTIELKINYFRPVWKARLRAEARVVRRGKTVGYVECDVTDDAGRLVAKASSTCMVLEGNRAAGR
jgi:uncharacterized protein (TIGR00369 family)